MTAGRTRLSTGLPLSDPNRSSRKTRPGRRSPPHGELWRDKGRCWRWRVVAANGRLIAESGEAYRRRIDAYRMLERAMDGFGCSHYEVRP